MNHRPALVTTFPQRLNGARVVLLAASANDQPSGRNASGQRHWATALKTLRLRRICRVQLRDRRGDEAFLASVDVAIDRHARIRAVLAGTRRERTLLLDGLNNVRGLRFVGGSKSSAGQRERLMWRHRRIALPVIDQDALLSRGFVRVQEPQSLHHIGNDGNGRPMLLEGNAANAWRAMRTSAAAAGVTIEPVSSFRSVAYQRGLIARKLKRGDTLEQILAVNAAPGYSEHHSGRAIDIGTPGCPPLDEAFELTPAFAWLIEHAPDFGFRLSYPRGNTLGVIYEPWHWFYIGGNG